MKLESEVGRGGVFSVTLPRELALRERERERETAEPA